MPWTVFSGCFFFTYCTALSCRQLKHDTLINVETFNKPGLRFKNDISCQINCVQVTSVDIAIKDASVFWASCIFFLSHLRFKAIPISSVTLRSCGAYRAPNVFFHVLGAVRQYYIRNSIAMMCLSFWSWTFWSPQQRALLHSIFVYMVKRNAVRVLHHYRPCLWHFLWHLFFLVNIWATSIKIWTLFKHF